MRNVAPESSPAVRPSLRERKREQIVGHSPKASRLPMVIKASLLGGLTSALAFLVIPLPFSPVPITGQSFGVMLSGLLLGPFYGALSMLIYLAMGCAGFPVFAGGRSGLGTLLGPSGGYLWGFIAGAFVTGLVARLSPGEGAPSRWHGLVTLCATFLGGIVTVHLFGVTYLAINTGRTLGEALFLGTLPFLPGDVLKALAATMVADKIFKARAKG